MIILSIETSCDDTGVAVLKKEKGKITTLSNVVSSQDDIHKKWGGVFPTEAKREHQKNLVPSLKKALSKASLLEKGSIKTPSSLKEILFRESILLKDIQVFFKKNKIKKIDAIAVTVGPGLEPCLWAGVNFARALSCYLNIPIIPVNHIKAHILFFLLEKKEIDFPAVGLIVSGGHTELLLINSLSSYELIGKTRDDAAGECFDKVARVLGLGYPGGPEISKKAHLWETKTNKVKPFDINLPKPMMHSKNYDFSFSGLKTAALYDFLSREEKVQKNKNYINQMAYETQEAIVDVLVFKLKKAIKEYNAKTAILGGGVTANKKLREKVKKLDKEFPLIPFFLPPVSLSTDNANMIGIASFASKERLSFEDVKADANMKIYNDFKNIKE